jgi:tetratricopeptide (TPR) repeat protein
VALLQLAKEDLAAGRLEEAKAKLLEAVSNPKNLGEGHLEGTKDNHIYYHLGLVWEALGNQEEAKKCFQAATEGAMEVAGMMYYYDQPADMILYQAYAKEKLGLQSEANARFYKLLDYGEQHLRDEFRMDYFAVSMPDMSVFDADMTEKNRLHCYYLMGLANLGLRKKQDAIRFFQQVLEGDCNHQNARIYLEEAKQL